MSTEHDKATGIQHEPPNGLRTFSTSAEAWKMTGLGGADIGDDDLDLPAPVRLVDAPIPYSLVQIDGSMVWSGASEEAGS